MTVRKAHPLATDRAPQPGQLRQAGGFVLIDDDGQEKAVEMTPLDRATREVGDGRHWREVEPGTYVTGGNPPVLDGKRMIVTRPRLHKSACLVGPAPFVRPELLRHHRITADRQGTSITAWLARTGVLGVLFVALMAYLNLSGRLS